jgi:hypothetical protein
MFFRVRISHVLRFISICDPFTDSASYVHITVAWNVVVLLKRAIFWKVTPSFRGGKVSGTSERKELS